MARLSTSGGRDGWKTGKAEYEEPRHGRAAMTCECERGLIENIWHFERVGW